MKKNYCSPGFLLFVLIAVLTIIFIDPVKGSSTNKGFLDFDNLTLKKISRSPVITQTTDIYSKDFVKLKLNDKDPSLLKLNSGIDQFGLKSDKRIVPGSFSLSEKRTNLLNSSDGIISFNNDIEKKTFIQTVLRIHERS